MGCDIHQVFEKRDASGVWHTWPDRPEVLRQRSYSVFGVLAGVRRDPGPGPGGVIAEPRGIPTDFSMLWAGPDMIERLLGDHSFSHLTALEILGHPVWPDGALWWREEFLLRCLWTFHVDTTSLEALASFRMVFGFDS